MKYTMIISLAVLIFSSCRKDNEKTSEFDGTYKGTFARYNQNGGSIQESEVTLTLNYPNWTGNSTIPKYPALNQGNFSEDDEVLKFTNTSIWTADFDWTFILDGSYLNFHSGDSLTFSKSYANGKVDVYKLKKQ